MVHTVATMFITKTEKLNMDKLKKNKQLDSAAVYHNTFPKQFFNITYKTSLKEHVAFYLYKRNNACGRARAITKSKKLTA